MSMDKLGRLPNAQVETLAAELHKLGERAGKLLIGRGAWVAPVKGIQSPHAPREAEQVLTSSGAQDTAWSANSGSAHLRRVNSETEGGDVDELVFMPHRTGPEYSGFVVAGWHSLTARPTEALGSSMAHMTGAIEHLVNAIHEVEDWAD